jgi:hypothetical protein
VGIFDGQVYLRRDDGAYYIWYDSIGQYWTISALLGVPGTLGWYSDYPDLTDTYSWYGTATGTATVT